MKAGMSEVHYHKVRCECEDWRAERELRKEFCGRTHWWGTVWENEMKKIRVIKWLEMRSRNSWHGLPVILWQKVKAEGTHWVHIIGPPQSCKNCPWYSMYISVPPSVTKLSGNQRLTRMHAPSSQTHCTINIYKTFTVI